MRLKIYTVYDCKAEAYLNPFYSASRGQAIRSWEKACNDPQTSMCEYPQDFTLFEIGDFDISNGQFYPYESKISLGTGVEFKKTPIQNIRQLELPTKEGN